MQITLKQTPGEYDIPIASLAVAELNSNKLIQIIDFGDMIPGNSIPPVPEINARPIGTYSAGNRLSVTNVYDKVMLTDEYVYDQYTGERTALWYYHTVKYPYTNLKAIDRTITHTIREGMVELDRNITNLVPDTQSYIIIRNSMVVEKQTGGVFIEINQDDWYLDYGGKRIVLPYDAVEHDIYRLSYKIIIPDIQYTADDTTGYRIECIPLVAGALSYCLVILASTADPIAVTYNRITGNTDIREWTEYTVAAPLFAEVTGDIFTDIFDANSISRSRLFYLTTETGQEYINVPSQNTDHEYTICSAYDDTLHISCSTPIPEAFSADWYPVITVGSFYSGALHYTTKGITGTYPVYRQETARILDRDIIAITARNIITSLSHDGEWHGVRAVTQNGTVLSINSINQKTGRILLNDTVSRKDTITVSYRAHRKGISFTDICLNPLLSHQYHNHNAAENVFLLILYPETISADYRFPFGIKVLPKYIEGRPYTYTYQYIDGLLNAGNTADRDAFRADILPVPAVCFGPDAPRIEPCALVYVINPVDEDAFKIEDSRLFGGGVAAARNSYLDYSLFDGERIDPAVKNIVHIPASVYQDVYVRIRQWHPDVRSSSTPDETARRLACDLINEKVRKFSLIGTVTEIVIAETN